MNLIFLLPLSYLYFTRIKKNNFEFYVLFEWLPAIFLLLIFSSLNIIDVIYTVFITYILFNCIYEIGYITNDLLSSKFEENGRIRTSQTIKSFWIVLWIIFRVLFFIIGTMYINMLNIIWISYFLSLLLIFSLHNLITNLELRIITFTWLAWFRFMTPLFFWIDENQLMGVSLSASISFILFRLLSYMDSKNLLMLENRQSNLFRIFFFSVPLISILIFWSNKNAYGYIFLTTYNFFIVTVGITLKKLIKYIFN